MSETTQTPGPAAPAPHIAAARDAWIGYGYDPAAFDAALSGGQPEPAPAKVLLDPPADLGGKLSDDAYAAAVADLRAAGVSEDAIKAAMAQDGRTVPEDDRTIEQRAHDAAYGFDRDYDPSQYRIQYGLHGQAAAKTDLAGFVQLDAEIRDWCSALNLQPGMASGIVESALAASRHWAGLSEPQRASYALEQAALLKRIAGADDYEALAGHALRFTGAAKLPFSQRLAESGALKSAAVILALGQHGQRISEWAGRIPPDTKAKP